MARVASQPVCSAASRRTAVDGEPAEADVDVPMRELSLVGKRKSDGEWSGGTDDGEADVFDGCVRSHQSVVLGAVDDCVDERVGSCSLLGPVRIVEEWVDEVEHSEAVVDREMHVAPKRLAAVDGVCERAFASCDGAIQHVESDGVQERLLVGEVPVERPDSNAGAVRDRVPSGLAAYLEDQLDRGVEEQLTVSLCIGAHQILPLCPLGRCPARLGPGVVIEIRMATAS